MTKKKKEKHHKKKSKKHKSKKYRSDSSEESEDEWEESEAPSNTFQSRKSDELESSSKPYSTTEQPTTIVSPLEIEKPKEPTKREDWIVSPLEIEKPREPTKREDWMSSSMLDTAFGTTNYREHKTKERKLEVRKKKEESNLEIYNARELNPQKKIVQHTSEKTEARVASKKTVGDGGTSWVHKAYERVKERAKEENISLEVLVKQRWGSMEKLEFLLNASKRNSRPSEGTKSTKQSSSSGWRKQSNQKSDSCNSESISRESSTKNLSDDNDISKSMSTSIEQTVNQSALPKNISALPKKALSEEEKNKLNAKLLRAELMGDDDLVAALRRQIEGGDTSETNDLNSSPRKRKDSSSSSSDEEVVLTRADKHGNLYPVKLEPIDDGKKKRKKKKIISTHDEKSGERVRYFEDDDKKDLKTMVEQERLTSADDQQAMLARLAGKHLGRTMGEDYTVDDMFVQASATKGETNIENRRIKEKAIFEDKLQKKQLSNCKVCFESPNIAKHLIISIGTNVYLSLPLNASLTEGHCQIIPMRHVATQTYLDENVIQEIKNYKSALTSMFCSQDEDVLFLETCKSLRGFHHCIIDCIPVPKEIGDMAPIYFKKAISEFGSDWSDNKKVITINSSGGVTKALPKGLPYFAVEFGHDGGFGHIIEEESFPHYFGKEIIGGMMDLEPRFWIKPPKESFGLHKKKVLKFSDSWKEHDWTSKIT